ncbi:hypothetical protein GF380_06080 [Candidatus Uhrbacteria bacterium]|nr:hypothetical protein [Candidatus Uhrbacteria bacterium]MBD3284545.1 hypothetical protein [Candidatus Uhrbacteria bacterium]
MAKGKKNKKKTRRQPPKPKPRPCVEAAPALPPPAPTPKPELSDEAKATLEELLAIYNVNIALGNEHLVAGRLEDASTCEAEARKAWQTSKRISAEMPIGPGPVRKLRAAVDKVVRELEATESFKRSKLKKESQRFLDDVVITAGRRHHSPFRNYTGFHGDAERALARLLQADPDHREILRDSYETLEAELRKEVERRREAEAEHLVKEIDEAMLKDTNRALDLLKALPDHLKPYVKLEDVEEKIEAARPAATACQRRIQEHLRQIEESRRQDQCRNLIDHIMGTHRLPVKARDSKERYRQALRDDRDLLDEAIAQSTYGNHRALKDEIEKRRDHGREIWRAHQDLTYVVEAKDLSSEEFCKRLIEAENRVQFDLIWERDDVVRKFTFCLTRDHINTVRETAYRLNSSDCRACLRLAVSLLRRLGDHDVPSCYDLRNGHYQRYQELHLRLQHMEASDCGHHKPVRAPWQDQPYPNPKGNGRTAIRS